MTGVSFSASLKILKFELLDSPEDIVWPTTIYKPACWASTSPPLPSRFASDGRVLNTFSVGRCSHQIRPSISLEVGPLLAVLFLAGLCSLGGFAFGSGACCSPSVGWRERRPILDQSSHVAKRGRHGAA